MAVANQTGVDIASEFATLSYVVQQALSRVQTLTLVKIVSCSNAGGVDPVGTVTVQPLVNLMSGERTAVQHKPLYQLPYLRIQGGSNAVVIDPKPGDIGLAGFCSRDISAVKKTKNIANPGSFRQFDIADGVYIGGCLNGEPKQYIQFSDEGVKIVSPSCIELHASTVRVVGSFEQAGGEASFAGDASVGGSLTAQIEVTAGNISLTTHKHPTAPAGPPSEPTP